jgi:hypothetical protein
MHHQEVSLALTHLNALIAEAKVQEKKLDELAKRIHEFKASFQSR